MEIEIVKPRYSVFIPIVCIAVLIFGTDLTADQAKIVKADSYCDNNLCRFDVTLSHADSGWEHYADSWRVLTQDGEELGKRVLLHPHVNEQPFTRSLSGVEIPSNISVVWIESHDSVHGTNSEKFRIDL